MFRIADGREHFYQWDLDRQIIVEDNSVTEVHFCNRTDDCSLVVEVIDGLANVPNVILQKSFDIRVFGYDGKATRYDEAFKVKARTKPTDYVYTEVEIKRYEDLEKRIDEIEQKGFSEEVVNNAVVDYFEKNPIETVTKVSELENDAGYATEKYVNDAIANIDIPEGGGGDVDLSNYYTKEETDQAIYNSKDTYYLDFSSATSDPQPATEDMIEFITRFTAGQNVCAHIKSIETVANSIRGWQPVTVYKVLSSYRFTANAINPQQVAGNNPVPYYVFEIKQDSTGDWVYYRNTQYSITIATKDYVDSLFEGIATAEGGAY